MESKHENSRCGSGVNASDSDSEGEEQDEPSSTQEHLQDVLTSFREKWQKEILSSPKHNNYKQRNVWKTENNENCNEDFENNARTLFLKGVEMERAGKLYEAIQFYRRAVQIVPDIELKLDNLTKPVLRQRQITENSSDEHHADLDELSESSDSDNDIIEDGQLLPRIQKKMLKVGPLCCPKFTQTTTHISTLPVEIILYILRWVVSGDLDLRSLEFFGSACRGFYLCARDPEVWRLSCIRVWGLNCGPSPGSYGTWRNMFIERARIHFNGCYISKTTYIRNGENNFQDQFYRPWHLVAYYRYLRFFPEGIVLMLTSPDEPAQCVGQMKNRNPRQPIMIGYYRLKDDKVTLVVHRQDSKASQGFKRTPKRKDTSENGEQTFHMELQIKSHNRKRHVQLAWTHYSVLTRSKRGDESTCNFDLLANRFPPLWFSRVKSYTAVSETPLT